MVRFLLVCIFLIIGYDILQLFTGLYPSFGHNTNTIDFIGNSKLTYQEDSFLTEDGSLRTICPDINYEIGYINNKGETLALIYRNIIYNSNYQPIYNIIKYIFHYELTYINGTIISKYKYNSIFVDDKDNIIGTVNKNNKDYELNFTQRVDARLYKTFLASLSYSDSNTCSVFFFYSLIIIIVLLMTIVVVYSYNSRKTNMETEMSQQLIVL